MNKATWEHEDGNRVVRVAKAYCAVLREWLTPEEMESVRAGASYPDDHCDGNMALAEAMEKVLGREPWLPSDAEAGNCTEAEEVDDLNLWNAAYDLASEQHFDL